MLYSGNTTGSATITVTYSEGGYSKTTYCNVNVSANEYAQIRGEIKINLEDGKEKQYILNGSTFFNGRYEDYLDSNYEYKGRDTPIQEDKPKKKFKVRAKEDM
jgi:hypothetical protein